MKENRVVRLIKSLSHTDIRGFVQYVSSPLFNQNPKVVRLVSYVSENIIQNREVSLDKEALSRMEDLPPMSDQQSYDLFALVNRLLESYLAWLDFSRDESAQSRHLLAGLSTYGHPDDFNRSLHKAAAKLDTQGDIGSRLQAYQVAEIAAMQGRKAHGREADPTTDANFSDMVHRLDRFYLLAKLKYSCETLNRNRVVNSRPDLALVEEIRQYLDSGGLDLLNDPYLRLYYQVLLTLLEPDETAHYTRLMALLAQYHPQLIREEQQALYTFAQNYCIRKINAGNPHFQEELFLIYQQLLNTGMLLEHGLLAHWHYKNMATVGLRLKKFDWVRDFLEKYRLKISKADQENAYCYNLSAYHYESGHFKEALRLLHQVEFTDVFYHLSAKSLLLKIYFEQEDDDGLNYLIHAFQAFLKRNKHIPEAHFQIHHNLLRYVKKVNRLRQRRFALGNDTFQRQFVSLNEEIMATREIANRTWLLEQMKSLEPGTRENQPDIR